MATTWCSIASALRSAPASASGWLARMAAARARCCGSSPAPSVPMLGTSRACRSTCSGATCRRAGMARAVLQALLEEYGAVQQQFESQGGYAWAHRVASVRAGLGLADLPEDMPVARLSGGQKTRLGLARLLLSDPRLLLID